MPELSEVIRNWVCFLKRLTEALKPLSCSLVPSLGLSLHLKSGARLWVSWWPCHHVTTRRALLPAYFSLSRPGPYEALAAFPLPALQPALAGSSYTGWHPSCPAQIPPGSGGRERRWGNGDGGSAAAPWALGAGGQHADISHGLPHWRPVVGVVGSPVYRRAD